MVVVVVVYSVFAFSAPGMSSAFTRAEGNRRVLFNLISGPGAFQGGQSFYLSLPPCVMQELG